MNTEKLHIPEIPHITTNSENTIIDEENSLQNGNVFTHLSHILRLVGVAVIVIASITFLVQGFNDVDLEIRHWMFYGITISMSFIGLFFGKKYNETKGARAFLGLSLGVIPVLFTQLGAILYDLGSIHSFTFSSIVSSSTGHILLCIIVTIVTALPISLFSFSILSRQISRMLTMSFFISSSMLLIPIRDNSYTVYLILALATVVISLDMKYCLKERMHHNVEGYLARLMPLIPLGILIGRSLYYETTVEFYGILMSGIGAFLFVMLRFNDIINPWGKILTVAGMINISVGGYILLIQGIEDLSIDSLIHLYVLPLPLVVSLLLYSFGKKDTLYRFMRTIALVVLFFDCLYAMMFQISSLTALVTLIFGITLITAGILLKERVPFVLGTVSLFSGMFYFGTEAFSLYSGDTWVTLSIVGVIILIVASFFEMKGKKIQQQLHYYVSSFKQWR